MYSCQNYFAVYRIMYRIRALRYCFYCVYLTSYSTPPYILPLDKKQMNLLFCSRLIRIFDFVLYTSARQKTNEFVVLFSTYSYICIVILPGCTFFCFSCAHSNVMACIPFSYFVD